MKNSSITALIAWQWSIYGNSHQDRRNLLIHVVAVPLFAGGVLAALIGLFGLAWHVLVLGLAGMALGFALQGIGHRYERQAPPAFTSRGQFVIRLFIEQFVVFPRFVLSGECLRRLRHPKTGDAI